MLEITLNGKKERFQFNNYARNELRRFFAGDKDYLSEGELMQAIIDKWKENEHLLLKMLVYAGILGDSLAGKRYDSRLSEEEIGTYIGDAHPDELIAIWREFLDQQGFNLSRDDAEQEEEESTPESEKKKMKTT